MSSSTARVPKSITRHTLSEPAVSACNFASVWDEHLAGVVTAVLAGNIPPGRPELTYRKVLMLVDTGFQDKLVEEIGKSLDAFVGGKMEGNFYPNLSAVIGVFTRFESSLSALARLFNALDRQLMFVREPDLHALAFDVWRRHFEAHTERLVRDVLGKVEMERRKFHSPISESATTLIFQSISLAKKTGIFGSHFEPNLLSSSQAWYRESAGLFVQSCQQSLSGFLQFVESTFAGEHRLRTAAGLPTSTCLLLDQSVHVEIILAHFPALIQKDLILLVEADDAPALQKLFTFASLLEEHILVESVLKHAWGESVRALVARTVEQRSMPDLIDRRVRLSKIVVDAFRGKPSFQQTLKDCVESVLNTTQVPVPLLLAEFVDSPQSAEMAKEVLALFKLLSSKDMFEAHYRGLLGKRLSLISSNFPLLGDSLTQELGFVALLKAECGAGYTNRLESMIRDIQTSEEINAAQGANWSNVFHAAVVTHGVWPATLQGNDYLGTRIPPSVKQMENQFLNQYKANFSKRSIKFNYAFTQATLRYRRKGELVCSFHQALILLLFNDTDSVSNQAIEADLELTQSDVAKALVPIVECGILIAEDGGMFSLNARYASSSSVVVLNKDQFHKPSSQDRTTGISEEERLAAEAGVVEDRQHQLDAVIIRIMKGVRRCSQTHLIHEARDAMKFNFSNADILKRILSLVDRDFLEKEDQDYVYLA